MIIAVLSTVAVILTALVAVLTGVVLRRQPPDIRPPTMDYSLLQPLTGRLEGMERRIQELTKAVAEGIEHVDRNEKRVRGIVVGAVKRFENSEYFDASVDAEMDTIQGRDAEGGGDEELQPVPDHVAGVDQSPWSGVPGMGG